MSGWLQGVVKEVPSGDTVVIAGKVKSGPPPEKRLTLSSLVAPKLGKRDGSTLDEPYAWQSREFLRNKCIGQQVVFRTDYTVEAIGNREFGSVFLNQQDNVALSVVAAGWCKVRATGSQQSPYIEDLKKAEEAAQSAGRGLWNKDSTALSKAIRDSGSEDAFNATTFLQSVGKGKTVNAIVEAVINGSMLRVTLLPSLQSAMIQVCGVQAPSMGRRAAAEAAAPADGAPPTAASIAALPATAQSNAEPYARESKHLTESRVLNREVTLVAEGVDKYNNLFATVQLPAAAEGQPKESLAELLVKEGLAKVMEFSVNMLSTGGQKLRDIERTAKQQKIAIWTNYVPAATNQGKLSDTFTGKVVEVVSGDCIVVKDSTTHAERRIQLSSLRAPRMATRDRPADPWATEAKEFLRKRLVGREVEVKMEYTRKVPAAGELGPGGAGDRELAFGNVELAPEKGEERQNVSEMVVARGFAQVVRHRSDEERSSVYDKLLECEELAKQAKRGISSAKEPPPNRINDVSLPGNAAKAKQYLPFFQRAGKMPAVVEYVLSGHRLKLSIPKEGVCIVFAPSGIKTPSRAMPASAGRAATTAEPYCEEAIAFTREHCMQRDAEVTIESMDRGGTFLGHITISGATPQSKPFSLALNLIRAGLARIQPNMDPSRLVEGSTLAEAQRQAKEARLRIWEKWTPEQEAAENGTGEDEAGAAASNGAGGAGPSQEVLEVVVTEVTAADEFYVQLANEPRLGWISEQLAAAGRSDGPVIPPELRVGQLCLGQYTLDNQWYRAYVERVNQKESTYDVFFIDYGNKERLPANRIRVMDQTLAAVPPQVHQAALAYIKVPSGSSEHAGDARACLAQLLGSGQPMLAYVVSRERAGPKDRHPKFTNGKMSVVLLEAASGANMGAELLAAGYAQLPKLRKVKDAATKEAIQKLQEYEDEAREARRGIFVYGDPGDSEDETPAAGAKPAGAWGKRT